MGFGRGSAVLTSILSTYSITPPKTNMTMKKKYHE